MPRLSADPAIRCVRRPQTRRSDEAHNGDGRVRAKRAAAARLGDDTAGGDIALLVSARRHPLRR